VEQAMDEYDALGRNAFLAKYRFGPSRRYLVLRDGRSYDSKAIAGAAVGFEHPQRGPLTSEEFTGGESGAKGKLEALGFEVVAMDGEAPIPALPLRDALEQALQTQRDRSPAEWSRELQEAVALTFPTAIRAALGSTYRVKGSTGFGRQAEVPWVSVLPWGTKGASEGRYVVYLFAAGGTRVYLALSQAVTGRRKRELPGLAAQLREAAGSQPDLLDTINLGTSGGLGERYGLATAYAREYQLADLPSNDALSQDLNRFVELMARVRAEPEPEPETEVDEPAWIFQANPDKYDIDRALRELPAIEWTVRQYTNRVHAGDRVYLWRSGSEAGVVGVGRIEDEPTDRLPDPAEDSYYLKREEFTNAEPRVRIDIERVLKQPLLRSDLREDPVLGELMILRFANATVYDLTPEQDARLRELVGDAASGAPSYVEPSFDEIADAVAATGLTISEQTLRRYHLSLKTRGFVVLSGISGTGKTWLAQAYAESVAARSLVVPVAPNWTTNEDLLGFLNPLDGVYHDTAFSNFLRAAAREYSRAVTAGQDARPFHLILDEMNLARVEYYFAKFLSAMELRARSDDAEIELAPGQDVPLPPNLKFVGTVNVDETTQGFADKVYDRSQLLELTIDRQMVEEHLSGRPYAATVADVWDALRDVAPFAFRVLDEMAAYIDEAEAFDVEWPAALDEQLLQKVLPKVKGTDLRIMPALRTFKELAADRFPLSYQKASAMLATFDEHGFTSYF
jgi:MoxR-like ATPase/predicted RNA-binding protein with PUA-like domain